MFNRKSCFPFGFSRTWVSCILGALIVACILISSILIPVLATETVTQGNIVEEEKAFLLDCSDFLRGKLNQFAVPLWEVAGLVQGMDLPLPPFNGSVGDRTDGPSIAKFDFVVNRYANLYPSPSTSIFVAPGGVITQVEPSDDFLNHKDLMLPEFRLHISSFLNSTVSLHQTRIVVQNDTVSLSNAVAWKVLQVYLVYQEPLSNSSGFWGLTGSWTPLQEAINVQELFSLAEEHKMDLLVASFSKEGNFILPIASTLGFNVTTPQSVLLDFLISSQKMEFVMDDYLFHIFVRRTQSVNTFIFKSRVPWVLFFAFIGLTTVFSIILGVNLALPLKIKAGYFYARWKPPFAVLTIGPHKGEKMLDLAGDILSSARESAKLHFHACQVPQLEAYCTTYILRSVKEAVEMGSAVLKTLQNESLDFPYPFLTEESPVLVLAVHWCENAEVNRHFTEGFLICRGPDIRYAANLLNIGIGNSIVLSSKAREKLDTSPAAAANLHEFVIPSRSRDAFHFFVDSSSIEMVQAFIYAQESLKHSSLVECVPIVGKKGERSISLSIKGTMSSYPVSAFLPLPESKISQSVEKAPSENEESNTILLAINPSSVPEWLDRALRKIYEVHPLTPGPAHWLVVRDVIYYFYFGYALLFQPLAPHERRNITDCLAMSFGVPTARFYEHLAVHGALHFVQSIKHHHE